MTPKIIKFFTGLFLVLTLASLSSCDKGGELKFDGIPFQSKEDGQWGILKPNGKIVAENEFKSTPSPASDGRYWCKNSKGYWELYSLDSEAPISDVEFRYVSMFRNGKALVTKRDENVSIINTKGEMVTDLSKVGKYKPDYFSNFNGEVMIFSYKEKMGVCNAKGEVILKPIYSTIYAPEDGKIIAVDSIAFNSMIAGDSVPKGNTYVFNYKGEEILKLPRKKYQLTDIRCYGDYLVVGNPEDDVNIYAADEGYANIKCGIINMKGEVIVKPSDKYRMITGIMDDMFIYGDGENMGVKNFKGEKIIAPKYVNISFSDDHIIALKGPAYEEGMVGDPEDYEATLYNKKGEKILNKKYIDLKIFDKYIFAKTDPERWQILDMKGEKIKDMPKIYNIIDFDNTDYMIITDKIDVDKFVKNLDFSANSLNGLTLTTTAQQALKLQSESYSSTNTPKAADYANSHDVTIYRQIDGVSITETITYPTALSHQNYRNEEVIDYWWDWGYYYHINRVPTGYTFTTSMPQSLQMSFDNYGILRGKLKPLYKAICKRFAEMGTLSESNSGASVYQLPGGKWAVVYIEDHNVTAKWGALPASDRNIFSYDGNKEKFVNDWELASN